MMKLIRTIVAMCIFINVYGQQMVLAKSPKKNIKMGDKYFDIGDYYSALFYYKAAQPKKPADDHLNYNMGVCKFNLNEVPDSVFPHFANLKTAEYVDAHYYLGCLYNQMYLFEKAWSEFDVYKVYPESKRLANNKEIDRLKEVVKDAEKAMKNPIQHYIKNLGMTVNTPYHEYVPLILSDEKHLYFTSQRPETTGGGKDEFGRWFEDVYYTQQEDGKWSTPKNIGGPVNTNTHDACVALSADGQIMYIYRTAKTKTTGDLYMTRATVNGWGEPQYLGLEFDTPYQESSLTINGDNDVVYISSNRPGGFGGKDLYRIVKMSNGKWSKAMNLGPTINTAYDEDAPFIHPNGKTLYFSSRGHNTIGGYDVFKSYLDIDDTTWSEPADLGFPINTTRDDLFFVVSADGNHGYYSTDRKGGFGGQDLYSVDIKYSEKDLVYRTCFAYDKLTQKPIKARATIYLANHENHPFGIYSSNQNTGKFILLTSPQKDFKIVLEADGYETQTVEIKAMNNNSDLEDLPFYMSKTN